ncbi:Asp23/Gls24 family envelope stress response protein [Streptomyces aureocirculatus]|uniref:Asp23/Gls24 family envelope stress response protein n=1 Tax=Streptomyces aureocirculatus TaxID=67275 RepID=UPI0004CC5B8D|nr:Asp23/Gls24 family envelope stress response protein [Streptomyces aureocirculatus]
MTDQQAPRTLADTVGAAVLATRGVAFLRPGLAELLRSSVGLGAARGGAGVSGVRVRRQGTKGLDIEVHVVLNRGHRALDVTRAVRAAVLDALLTEARENGSAQVKVTVTGVV